MKKLVFSQNPRIDENTHVKGDETDITLCV